MLRLALGLWRRRGRGRAERLIYWLRPGDRGAAVGHHVRTVFVQAQEALGPGAPQARAVLSERVITLLGERRCPERRARDGSGQPGQPCHAAACWV